MKIIKYIILLLISIAPIQGMNVVPFLKEKFKQIFSRTESERCAICLDDLRPPIRILICQHQFDAECLATWLIQHNSCPLCRGPAHPLQAAVNNVIPPVARIKAYALSTKNILVNNAMRAKEILRSEALLKKAYTVVDPTIPENALGYFMAMNISLSYCITYGGMHLIQQLPEKYQSQLKMRKQPPPFSSKKILKLAALNYAITKICIPHIIQDTNLNWPVAFLYGSIFSVSNWYIFAPDEVRTFAAAALSRFRPNHPEQS